jgi:hypothetical protein
MSKPTVARFCLKCFRAFKAQGKYMRFCNQCRAENERMGACIGKEFRERFRKIHN